MPIIFKKKIQPQKDFVQYVTIWQPILWFFFSFTMEVTLERHLYGYSLQPALKTDLNGSGEYQKSSEQYVIAVFLCLQAPNS